MRCVIDIECNALVNPTKIWIIVCKDIDTGIIYKFRNLTDDETSKSSFLSFCDSVSLWIGHNILAYDFPVIRLLLNKTIDRVWECCYDTLIISKMCDYGRKSHSLEAYGTELDFPKLDYSDWSKLTPEMEVYCANDVELNHRVFTCLYAKFIRHTCNRTPIKNEQNFQSVVLDLNHNGFAFNSDRALTLLNKVKEELGELDGRIQTDIVSRLRLIREIHPKRTKYGTLNRTDFRWVEDGDLSEFNGGPFSRCRWEKFNPASHRQVADILALAGWRPTDKTKAHILFIREGKKEEEKQCHFAKYGYKINEQNLSTLPSRAPSAAKTLARRILLESRRRTLTEWLNLVEEDGRIHGQFMGIGAWTQRMAHQKPNMANIPNSHELDGSVKLLGAEMRSLFIAPKNRLLLGVDAEGIQLRIFAHYINDPEFTDSLIKGKKSEKTDCHSLNQRILGSVCKSRAAAKRFIYAMLLGAGMGKLAEVLECSVPQAKEALDNLLIRYQGFQELKQRRIPQDAKRGYFSGLDGRQVYIPGETQRDREHLAISGYLQNGEVVVMKRATLKWMAQLNHLGLDYLLVNLVHDEWQTETINDFYYAKQIAEIQCNALREVGEELKLNCPLAGSYGDDPNKPNTWTIGRNWKTTH
jgi:DNA polymerase I